MPSKKRKVVVSAGPVPARLDSVKFITNRFKGGLALETALRLADEQDFDVTLVAWTYTPVPESTAGRFAEVVRVRDVFEYYDWYAAHAKDYDAFVMAAAVANLTPVKPWDGKFPSHLYAPGDEFDIKFMIAPRAIDAIKPLNPRACLIGYKLFDAPDDASLVDAARHTLSDSKANIIFANTPSEAKSRKLALTQDGSVIPCTFDEHCDLVIDAIRQHYYGTSIEPLTEAERADPDIREALATVENFEGSFDGYGTVAIAVQDHPGMFATTSRGHESGPVLVRGVDTVRRIVHASGKATLNAPAMGAFLWEAMARDPSARVAVHRHFGPGRPEDGAASPADYVFPGTAEETEYVYRAAMGLGPGESVTEPYHGYILARSVLPVDWTRYYEQFPGRYFKRQPAMASIVKKYNDHGGSLELGANAKTSAAFAYDPAVETAGGKNVGLDEIAAGTFPFAYAWNAMNYIGPDALALILSRCGKFIANTFLQAPEKSVRGNESVVLDAEAGLVRHTLRLPDDNLVRHSFHAYGKADYEALGLTVVPYGKNSAFVTKGLDGGDMAMLLAVEETGNPRCPACGGDMAMLLAVEETGNPRCPACGAEIDLKTIDVSDNDEDGYGDMTVELACPVCGRELTAHYDAQHGYDFTYLELG